MVALIIVLFVITIVWVTVSAGAVVDLVRKSLKSNSVVTNVKISETDDHLRMMAKSMEGNDKAMMGSLLAISKSVLSMMPGTVKEKPKLDFMMDGTNFVRVYAVLFKNLFNQFLLVMALADGSAHAKEKGLETIKSMGYQVADWSYYTMNQIDVPLGGQTAIAPSKYNEKPLNAYISDLLYVHDKFTTKPTEKKVITTIINNIKQKYDGQSKSK